MHRPFQSLIFGLLLFAVLGLLSLIFPEHGITVSPGLSLHFPSIAELYNPPAKTKDISNVLKTISEVDTSFTLTDTVSGNAAEPEKKEPAKLSKGIQMTDPAALSVFFDALKSIGSSAQSVRVMHYGDSQIEGDRMTDYIRLKLQSQFGGSGPGLLSLMPLTQSVGYRVSQRGEGWDRYNVFTAKDKRVVHKNYGVMAGFCRYSDYSESGPFSAGISISGQRGNYNKLRLFYGGARTATWYEYYDGPALISADSLEAGSFFRYRDFPVSASSTAQTIDFSGNDSPDFYGMSLEGDKGVIVDNIPLRGSSGTFFHLINHNQLREFYRLFNVKLFILQFGGNTLPALRDSTMAGNYARYIRAQISMLKKMSPGTSILFVGPSDMSIKSGTGYETYPLLEVLRDELKKEVLAAGCAFFDLYDAMGGKNSMPAWVEQKLAASDYTHFSPKGARQMATLLYSALIGEYRAYLKNNPR